MFPEVTLRGWLTDVKKHADYDLTNSGLTRYDTSAYPDVIPPRLQDLPAPPSTSLKSMVGEEYDVDSDQIRITGRCQHSNFIATAAARDIAESKEEVENQPRVLVESPTYQPLEKTPPGLGLAVDRFDRRPNAQFAIEPELVEEAMTDDTVLIVISNRHNPSGQLADQQTLKELSDIAVDHDAYLLVDEVYSPFVLETPDLPRTPFGGVTATGLPNTVISNSLTKFHGLYDISVGWLVGPPEFITRASIIEHHTNAVARPSLQMAKQVLMHNDEFIQESRSILENRYSLLDSFIEDHPSLSGEAIPYNVIAFVTHDHVDGTSISDMALDRGVALQPGRFFDMPEWFRISLGEDLQVIEEGLDRLDTVIGEL